MQSSKALTKIQSIIVLLGIISAVISSTIYLILSNEDQNSDTIKIGILADIDGIGERSWKEAILAAEQINAEGGLLGRQVEIIGEDIDLEPGLDMVQVSSALTRLITHENVDLVLGGSIDGEALFVVQNVIAEHKIIYVSGSGTNDEYTQRVLDDYDTYKYFFGGHWNATSIFQGMTDSLLLLRNITGFNKIGYLGEDSGWTKGVMEGLDYVLPEIYGFDLVYQEFCPIDTIDFSSYFAAAEEAGVEIMLPLLSIGGVPFVREYSDRQSPMVVYGGTLGSVSSPSGWESTDGKCEYITVVALPAAAGYPLTSKTLPSREAYIDRWNEEPGNLVTYDFIRFFLFEAINKAKTVETEELIKAMEETKTEGAGARTLLFTSSHGVMMGENPNDPNEDYAFIILFQWQDGVQVPIYPKKIMEEAGATYLYPDWDGPWDEIS